MRTEIGITTNIATFPILTIAEATMIAATTVVITPALALPAAITSAVIATAMAVNMTTITGLSRMVAYPTDVTPAWDRVATDVRMTELMMMSTTA